MAFAAKLKEWVRRHAAGLFLVLLAAITTVSLDETVLLTGLVELELEEKRSIVPLRLDLSIV